MADLQAGYPPPPPPPQAEREPRQSRKGPVKDACIERVVAWLRQCELTEVVRGHTGAAESAGEAVEAVLSAAKRQTWQQAKAFKHRSQVEAIAAHCLRCLPPGCETVVEMGAGQAVLGHAVSMASGLPLVAIERRGNTDAFDAEEGAEARPEAPAMSRVQADIADEGAWPEKGEIALLAKHLCGGASDIAVDTAVSLGSRLSLLCLAPCCHATMSWTLLPEESKNWFAEAGFSCTYEDFAMLIDTIRLWRAGMSEAGGKYVPCAKWKLRQFLADAGEIQTLGRKACRAIDEARLARLRACGLDVAMVEYCGASTTPDNVLILAAAKGALSSLSSSIPSAVAAPAPELSSAGVVLEFDPGAPPSLHQRLTAFLHEQHLARFAAFRTLVPLSDELSSRVPGLVCTAASEDEMLTLLGQLMVCPLVKRAVTRLLPFSKTEDSIKQAAEAAVQLLAEAAAAAPDGVATVRVLARPRELEAKLCSEVGPTWLSPVKFTHVLCVTPGPGGPGCDEKTGDDEGDASRADGDAGASIKDAISFAEGARGAGDSSASLGRCRFALIPRCQHDLSAWAAARQKDDTPKASWRFVEAAIRWPGRICAASVAALWTDRREACPWLEPWADQYLSKTAPLVELRAPGPTKECSLPSVSVHPVRGAWDGPDAPLASVLLVDVAFGGDEAIDALEALLRRCTSGERPTLSSKGVAVLRLRCGRSTRAVKRWHRETAQRLESKLGTKHVELLHLLSDKEMERTAVVNWDVQIFPPLS